LASLVPTPESQGMVDRSGQRLKQTLDFSRHSPLRFPPRLRVRPAAPKLATVRRSTDAANTEDRARAGKPELRGAAHPWAPAHGSPHGPRAFLFASSRLRVRPTAPKPTTVRRSTDAQNAEDRARAGKPELRGTAHPWAPAHGSPH